jgi:hypothetical protein
MADSPVPKLEAAIQLNRYYAHCLKRADGRIGWIDQFGQIGQEVGFNGRAKTEENLAQLYLKWVRQT